MVLLQEEGRSQRETKSFLNKTWMFPHLMVNKLTHPLVSFAVALPSNQFHTL